MKRILLCGNSVIIGGLHSSLSESKEFEVHLVKDLTVRQDIKGFDSVIIDIKCTISDEFFSQFKNFPRESVAGIDADAGRLSTMDGSNYTVRSIDEIIGWLQEKSKVLDLATQ